MTAMAVLAACNGTGGEEPEVAYTLTPAASAGPETDVTVDLDEYEPVTFSWGDAVWEGRGFATYAILFDKRGGDFSKPVAAFYAPRIDDRSITLSKDDIKSVYTAASETSKDKEVYVDWVVKTAAGGKALLSPVRTLHMTMTPDPDAFVPGNPIFIDGPGAAEAGQQMTYIPSIDYHKDARDYNDNSTRVKDFDYEIFTKIKGGEPFWFWSGNSTGGQDWIFSLDADAPMDAATYTMSIQKDANIHTVAGSDGLFRFRFNSKTREVYVKRIDRVSLRYWAPLTDNNMTYQGNGVWSVDLTIPAGKNGYKFLFFGLDGDQPTGSQYPTVDLGPTIADTPANYWTIVTVVGGAAPARTAARAFGIWRFPAEIEGKMARYTIKMNAEAGAYTHSIELL